MASWGLVWLWLFLWHEAYSATCRSWISLLPMIGKDQPPVCPTRQNPIQRLRVLLEENSYFGQNDAIKDVESRLKRNLHEIPDARTVMVLHFSGPTGVGKTFFSKLLAEALFKRKDDYGEPCGVLQLQMPYSLEAVSKEAIWEVTEVTLLRPIVEQLLACPRSLILIDDIQHLNATMLSVLKEAFDPSVQQIRSARVGKAVGTSQAIFILSSDLEDQQRTFLKPDLDKADAIKAIKQMAVSRWGSDDKVQITQWVQVVPFLRLSQFDMLNIIEHCFVELEDNIRQFLRINAVELPYSIDWTGRLFAKKGTREQVLDSVEPEFGARAIRDFIITQGNHELVSLANKLVTLSKAAGVLKKKDWFGLETYVVDTDIVAWVDSKELQLEVDNLEVPPSKVHAQAESSKIAEL
eukprot:gb/GEZN01008350.1/.p1 GENE.gb/GEZN01008350.1/~~gb/GEZN01008350.1/.p1  ORF type:complete len:417 (-),score=57.22 gb/GEZN01008350.1/:188-1411(-)